MWYKCNDGGLPVLWAALFLNVQNALAVIGALLVILSILGAFETPVVQACIPSMLAGDDIIRGNAVVNQIASISYLVAPMLGGLFYAAFGLKPVMYASIACFFLTAFLECFIKLDFRRMENGGNVFRSIGRDFSESIQFIRREQPDILKMLLLAALSRFFVMGIATVGLPYIVRSVFGFDAKYYGAAESILAVATICGSVLAGLFAEKLKKGRLFIVSSAIGLAVIPAGLAFLLPAGRFVIYGINMVSFCGMQIAISIFSIFAVSFIQQKTPNHLLGKVMSYTSAITLCVQPVGQMVYGFLFDGFRDAVWLVLIPTGVLAGMIGLLSKGLFERFAIPSAHEPYHEKEAEAEKRSA